MSKSNFQIRHAKQNLLYPTPGSCVPPGCGGQTASVPFDSWPQPSKVLSWTKSQHESLNPPLSADQESSVTGLAHLSPSFHQPIISRYPNLGRVGRMGNGQVLPQCGKPLMVAIHGCGLSARLIIPPQQLGPTPWPNT